MGRLRGKKITVKNSSSDESNTARAESLGSDELRRAWGMVNTREGSSGGGVDCGWPAIRREVLWRRIRSKFRVQNKG